MIYDLCTDLLYFLDMAHLPAADQRHPWLRYEVKGYTLAIVHRYEQRLATIWSSPVNRVDVLDFAGLTPEMRQDLAVRLRMVFIGEGQQSDPDKEGLRDYWVEISSDRDFLGLAPSYVFIRDPARRLCHRMIAYSISGRGREPEKVTGVDLFYLCSMDRGTANVPYLLAQYFFHHAEGRKSGARLSGGHFIGRLTAHFGLVTNEGLRGLHAAAAGEGDKAGLADEEAVPDVPAPEQAPPPPPPAPQAWTMYHRIERVKEEMRDLRHDILMDTSGHPYQAFDSTLVGSSLMPYQKRVRPRTGDASTLAAPHADD
ncbi:hypothetical protein Tco_1534650 [Tanacetum coccineum]